MKKKWVLGGCMGCVLVPLVGFLLLLWVAAMQPKHPEWDEGFNVGLHLADDSVDTLGSLSRDQQDRLLSVYQQKHTDEIERKGTFYWDGIRAGFYSEADSKSKKRSR